MHRIYQIVLGLVLFLITASTCAAAQSVDVDLTTLSSTVRFGEVFNMMTSPEDYLGRTVRMRGNLAVYVDEDEEGKPIPEHTYYTCEIPDAAACCSQGLEFVLADPPSRPDEWPAQGSEITVVGRFFIEEQQGLIFCRLVDAVFE